MERRNFIKYIAGATALGAAGGAGYLTANRPSNPEEKRRTPRLGPPRKHNVILISIDCLNQRQFKRAITTGITPAIESLKNKSIEFSHAHAHAPWTTPSHMCMLTGLYPRQHGYDIPFHIMTKTIYSIGKKPTYSSLADILSNNGYETAAFTGNGSISAKYGLGQGFDIYDESVKNNDLADLPETMKNLGKWFSSRDHSRPFFLFFHTYDFHNPMAFSKNGAADNEDVALKFIDDNLAELFKILSAGNVLDNSIVFFTGDHGSNMINTERKCCFHGAGHYEENLNIPLLLKLPGKNKYVRNLSLARHIDMLPTVLDITRIPGDEYMGAGISLLNRFKKDGAREAAQLYSFSEADAAVRVRFALTNGEYKYIYSPLTPYNYFFSHTLKEIKDFKELEQFIFEEELYNLMADPAENMNLLRGNFTEATKTLLVQFRNEMEAHLNMQVFYKYQMTYTRQVGNKNKKRDNQHLKSMKQLGYIR